MPAGMVSAAAEAASMGYRAALERVAFFPDLQRSVVAVSGTAALRVVNGLVSNDVSQVERGGGTYSFLLDRRGRVIVDLRVLPVPGFEGQAGDYGGGEKDPTPSTVWLDAPSSGLAALASHLDKYVPPIFAKHQPTSVAVYSLIGPLSAETLGRWEAHSGVDFGRRPDELTPLEATTVRLRRGVALLVRREKVEGPGFDLYIDRAAAIAASEVRDELVAVVADTGGVIAAASDWEILRVEAGLPRLGSELGPERLAQEAGQDSRAISFAKGCFTGQEVVARIHYRGHVNRHLRGLRWVSTTSAAPGSPGTTNGRADPKPAVGSTLHPVSDSAGRKPVGIVTSAVLSPRFGPIALAYIRRELEPGDTVVAADAPGAPFRVTTLPFTEW
ncbi:YgfZ/GcvT domain-containing protein [Candidatus Palauibacter sp.]|uniref:CAF17-like 4Fe-4S cluster assembly/insertion protein YgfZ n=1 Tax=Candidatus Palauibacter sp. TaxID=3101350 RepID=UPI003AF209EF